MNFSERLGITPPPSLQIESTSDELKNRLWNVIYDNFLTPLGEMRYDAWHATLKAVYDRLLKWQADKVEHSIHEAVWPLRQWFFATDRKWYEIYNFLEGINKFHMITFENKNFSHISNNVLEAENSGYRFVSADLAPITNQIEISEIEQSTKSGITGVSTHIATAIQQFSKKPTPDFRNTIKEAISAVESAATLIAGNQNNGDLSAALKLLKPNMHKALHESITKLYAYTCDAGGIRHTLKDDAPPEYMPTYAEAKFMLVTCSAIANYLISEK